MNSDELRKIWHTHSASLYKYIYYSVDNRSDAEDILQDVAVIALTNIDNLKDKDKVRSWLYSIAKNLIKKHYIKRKKTIHIEIECFDNYIKSYEEIDIDKMAMDIFINQLDPTWRRIITLNFVYGYSANEISAMFGHNWMKSGSIKNRITKITKLIANYVYGDDD